MILFHEDLFTQKCIIDIHTQNKSFIKMAMLLKKMGIANHQFMLVLTQPELQGVDPHDPNLSEDMKLRIAYECKTNPWFFFREVLRIPSHGGDPIHYELNRANMALTWCFLNSIDTFLTMPRQIGKTIGVLSIYAYLIYVLGRKIEIASLNKDGDLLISNVKRFKEIKEGLPSWMIQEGSAFNTNNQESVEYRPNGTKLSTFIAQSDKKRAAKQGRGSSFVSTHWDEFAFYVNNDLSYPSAIATTKRAGPDAKRQGIPCATMITTTAGHTTSAEGKYAHSFKSEALRFTEKLYDCKNNEELVNTVMTCSGNGNGKGFLYLEYSYKQLGKDDAWFIEATRGCPPDIIAMDYLNKWLHGAGESIVPKHLLALLEKNMEEPVSITIENSVVMRWFAEQIILNRDDFKNIPYIIGSDTSDNIGKDFTTIVMVNPKDMAVVMSCRCNQANMVYIANIIFGLLERFPNSIFIPEKNRAATLLDMLIHMISTKTNWNVFERIYNSYVQDQGDAVEYKKLDIQLGSVRKAFGFKTTSSEESRKLLYSKVLNTTVARNHTRIFDKTIIDEIMGLVVRNGRIDHVSGGNDDTLIAYLICCWFIMYGKNIYLYGIQSCDILSDFNDNGVNGDVSELKNRIRYLEEKIESKQISSLMEHAFKSELQELKAIMPEDATFSDDIISVHQVDKLTDASSPELSPAYVSHQLKCIF